VKRFLGLCYVSVCAHPRHIQESIFLFHAKDVREADRIQLAAAWTTVGSSDGGNCVGKERDKDRFGRERRRKIVRRKHTRELQKAPGTKQEAPQVAGSLGKWIRHL